MNLREIRLWQAATVSAIITIFCLILNTAQTSADVFGYIFSEVSFTIIYSFPGGSAEADLTLACVQMVG